MNQKQEQQMWKAINKKDFPIKDTPVDTATEIIFFIAIIVLLVLGLFGWVLT